MAKLIVKLYTGETIDFNNVDLKQLTPRHLIDEMVMRGCLPDDNRSDSYSILYKNNRKVALEKLETSFEQLRFADGDIIRIVPIGSGGGNNTYAKNRSFLRFYKSFDSYSESYVYKYSKSNDRHVTFDTCPQYNEYEIDAYTKKENKLYFEVERLRIDKCKIENELSNIRLSYEEKELSIEEEAEKIQKETEDLLEEKQNILQRKIDEYNQKAYDYNNLSATIQEDGFLGELFRLTSDLFGAILGMNEGAQSDKEKLKKTISELKQLQQEIEELQDQMHEIASEYESKISQCVEDLEELKSEKEKSISLATNEQKLLRKELEAKQQELERIEEEKNKYANVYSSVFATSEVKRKSHMLVQVYLHLFEETEKVKALAQESQKEAERRDYIPLQCKLKKGDKVDVQLNIYGETLLMSDKKSLVWQGSFTKCSFDYFVPKDIDVDELSCTALLTVNEIPVGEMRFVTSIVDAPRKLNPEIIAHKFNKVFVSYSHLDESKVKFLHEGLELGAVPHFFDRKYLNTGDVFPQVIRDYINSADLFILCWSENASKSEYVQKERKQALGRAFPQVQPEKEAKLRIYPMSIEPRAELPNDMKEYYHFGEI